MCSHAALYYRGRDCVRQSGGGWRVGEGVGVGVVSTASSYLCLRCLAAASTVCAWVALHFPHRVAACGARARVGEHRDVRRGSARGREPPPKPDRVQVHGVQWEIGGGRGAGTVLLARSRAAFLYRLRCDTVPVRRPSELTSLPRSVASDPGCTGTAYHTMYDGP